MGRFGDSDFSGENSDRRSGYFGDQVVKDLPTERRRRRWRWLRPGRILTRSYKDTSANTRRVLSVGGPTASAPLAGLLGFDHHGSLHLDDAHLLELVPVST